MPVAGVTCKQHNCECSLSTVELTTAMSECPATTCTSGTVYLRPTQQAQPIPDNSQQTMTTILLAGLAVIFGLVSITLAAW